MSNEDKKKVSIVVRGRVQGVGFRYYVQTKAIEIGVTGWVKNLYDGSVATIAEGKEEDLEQFLEKVKKGPSFSIVRDMDIKWGEFSGDFPSFEITF